MAWRDVKGGGACSVRPLGATLLALSPSLLLLLLPILLLLLLLLASSPVGHEAAKSGVVLANDASLLREAIRSEKRELVRQRKDLQDVNSVTQRKSRGDRENDDVRLFRDALKDQGRDYKKEEALRKSLMRKTVGRVSIKSKESAKLLHQAIEEQQKDRSRSKRRYQHSAHVDVKQFLHSEQHQQPVLSKNDERKLVSFLSSGMKRPYKHHMPGHSQSAPLSKEQLWAKDSKMADAAARRVVEESKQGFKQRQNSPSLLLGAVHALSSSRDELSTKKEAGGSRRRRRGRGRGRRDDQAWRDRSESRGEERREERREAMKDLQSAKKTLTKSISSMNKLLGSKRYGQVDRVLFGSF